MDKQALFIWLKCCSVCFLAHKSWDKWRDSMEVMLLHWKLFLAGQVTCILSLYMPLMKNLMTPMCIREKSLYTTGSQHFLPCDPIKKRQVYFWPFFPQVMASLWTWVIGSIKEFCCFFRFSFSLKDFKSWGDKGVQHFTRKIKLILE